jgi:hypothetical protein
MILKPLAPFLCDVTESYIGVFELENQSPEALITCFYFRIRQAAAQTTRR